MILPHLQPLAQTAIERAFNSLPEGLLIALCAWALLRVLPKQNSRTRFGVWFVALLAVVGSPLAGGFLHSSLTPAAVRSATAPINLPAHWAAFFFITWLLIACAMTARLIVGLVRLRQLRQSCVALNPDDLDPSLRSLVAELNAPRSFHSRPVSLSISSQIRVPAAIGLWNPTIALPSWALRDLSPSDLGIVLRHEFAHLRHWDDWTNLIQKLFRILFFFHPAVWWIENRLSLEREMACDDVVIAQTANPAGYASCLVSLLERSLAGRGWTMAQAIVHRAREASTRIAQILDNNRPAATRISKPALGLAGAFTILCLVMLPNTPQVISFEQPDAANSPYAAARIQPSSVPSLVHRASFQTSQSAVAPVPALLTTASNRGGAAAHAVPDLSNARLSAKLSRTSTYKPGYNQASRSTYDFPVARNTVYSSSTNAGFSAAAAQQSPAQSVDVAQGFDVAQRFNAAMDAASLVTIAAEDNLLGEDTANSAHPSIVLVEATGFIQPSGSPEAGSLADRADGPPAIVWHIQVWRVTVVNTTWKAKQPAPAAHST
ncbi:MAG: M56 family metallopeptidase [Terriglobales bacterium]